MMDTTNIKNGSRNSKHKKNIKLNPKEIQNLKKKELINKLNRNSNITFHFNLSSKLNEVAIKMETNDIDVAIILYFISYYNNENEIAKESIIQLTGTNDNNSFDNIYKSKVKKLQKNIEQKLDEDNILQEKDDTILRLLENIAYEIENFDDKDIYIMIYLIIFNFNNNDDKARTKLINNNFRCDIEDSLIIKLARPVDYYNDDDYTKKNIGLSYMNLYIKDECQDNFEYFEKALDYAIPYFKYDNFGFNDFIVDIFYKDYKCYLHLQKIVHKIEGHFELESILNEILIDLFKLKKRDEKRLIREQIERQRNLKVSI